MAVNIFNFTVSEKLRTKGEGKECWKGEELGFGKLYTPNPLVYILYTH